MQSKTFLKHQRRITKVSIIPNSPGFLENRLFSLDSLSGSHNCNTHWMQPMSFLRQEALKQDIQLDTMDILPAIEADIALFMELPSSPEIIAKLKRKAPHLKIVFMPIETPLGRSYLFNKANHEQFDAILTYNNLLTDSKRYFHFYLPAANPEYIKLGKEFDDRKPACMISSNSHFHWRTGLNVLRSGWRFSARDWWDYAFLTGNTNAKKRGLAKAFEQFSADSLDIFGDGWIDYSWGLKDRLLKRKTFKSAKGRLDASKLAVLGNYRFNICFENCKNDCGYISEKIFDALYGNSVPVYFGNMSIERHIPKECFVDARDFKSQRELVRFICECPQRLWEDYRRAGQNFLKSPAFEKFLPSAFVENYLWPICVLAGIQTGRSTSSINGLLHSDIFIEQFRSDQR